MNPILLGFLGSLIAGSATGVGALPSLFTVKVSPRLLNAMLGFAAGVMLAATCFSLLVPALERGSVWQTLFGLLLGAAFLAFLDRVIPHEHFIKGPEGPSSSLRRTWLFILAITLHNFPEGVAVGVGFGSGDTRSAISLAIGIGLQNMPEGLAVALPLIREGYGREGPFSGPRLQAWSSQLGVCSEPGRSLSPAAFFPTGSPSPLVLCSL